MMRALSVPVSALLFPLVLSALLIAAPAAAKPPKKAAAKPALQRSAHTPGFGDPAHGGLPGRYLQRADVQAWMADFAAAQQLSLDTVRAWLAPASYQRRAAQLVMPGAPGSRKDWTAYRDRFVEPGRLQAGLRFWATHAEALARAEQESGVPAAIVAGIVGVETYYGQLMGRFRALDVLATLAFDFPGGRSDRSAFFRDELAALLLLAQAEGRDPASFTGSFAGALGLGQFMPSSWRAYARDFDGDGHIDLMGNPADAVGSIANFLQQHGWRPGQHTHRFVPAPPASALPDLLAGDLQPRFDLAALRAAGVELGEDEALIESDGPWALQQLENGDAPPVYLLTSHNFWVLTRYNRSSYYALAVIQLGERLQQLREAGR